LKALGARRAVRAAGDDLPQINSKRHDAECKEAEEHAAKRPPVFQGSYERGERSRQA
jgi:hypothetical protein